MGIQPSKEASQSVRTGEIRQETRTEPQRGPDFEATALGEVVGPLVIHSDGASQPSLTQSSPQDRSSGQTRKLFDLGPMPAQNKPLELGDKMEILTLGGAVSRCTIRNLHPKSPIVKALRVHFGRDVDISLNDEVRIIAGARSLRFDQATKLPDFCSFVQDMRDHDIDDDSIAFLIANNVQWIRADDLDELAEDVGITGFRKMIDEGHHELASLLMPDMEDVAGGRIGLKCIVEALRCELEKQGIDLQKIGVSSDGTKELRTSLLALFCIDLCTRTEVDPVQAGRIVMRHLMNTDTPLPYQDEVMNCLRSMIETPEQGKRAVLALIGNTSPVSTAARAWMTPLLSLFETATVDDYMAALAKLNGLETLDFVMLGDDHTDLGFMHFQPIVPKLDKPTIDCLETLIETGARTEIGLSVAVAAFELLVWHAGKNLSKQKRSDLLALKQKLREGVSASPFSSISSRSEEVNKRIDAALKS